VARLRRLPTLQGFPVDAVPRSPYPNDSELYCAIRYSPLRGSLPVFARHVHDLMLVPLLNLESCWSHSVAVSRNTEVSAPLIYVDRCVDVCTCLMQCF